MTGALLSSPSQLPLGGIPSRCGGGGLPWDVHTSSVLLLLLLVLVLVLPLLALSAAPTTAHRVPSAPPCGASARPMTWWARLSSSQHQPSVNSPLMPMLPPLPAAALSALSVWLIHTSVTRSLSLSPCCPVHHGHSSVPFRDGPGPPCPHLPRSAFLDLLAETGVSTA